MSRPKHLNVPNTPAGIRRINEEQAAYDRDPGEYERQEREEKEATQREEEARREDFERQQTN